MSDWSLTEKSMWRHSDTCLGTASCAEKPTVGVTSGYDHKKTEVISGAPTSHITVGKNRD